MGNLKRNDYDLKYNKYIVINTYYILTIFYENIVLLVRKNSLIIGNSLSSKKSECL